MKVNPTQLRKDLYRLLDHVAETGEPVEIDRRGKSLRISVAPPGQVLDRLEERPGYLTVDPDEVVALDWAEEWQP